LGPERSVFTGTECHPYAISAYGRVGTSKSFPHRVTFDCDDPEWVVDKVSRNPDLLHAKGDLSILLSAALSWNESTALKALLEVGADLKSVTTKTIINYKGQQKEAAVSYGGFFASFWS